MKQVKFCAGEPGFEIYIPISILFCHLPTGSWKWLRYPKDFSGQIGICSGVDFMETTTGLIYFKKLGPGFSFFSSGTGHIRNGNKNVSDRLRELDREGENLPGGLPWVDSVSKRRIPGFAGKPYGGEFVPGP